MDLLEAELAFLTLPYYTQLDADSIGLFSALDEPQGGAVAYFLAIRLDFPTHLRDGLPDLPFPYQQLWKILDFGA